MIDAGYTRERYHFGWKHLGCVTTKNSTNAAASYGPALSDIPGVTELDCEDTLQDGHVQCAWMNISGDVEYDCELTLLREEVKVKQEPCKLLPVSVHLASSTLTCTA